MNLSLNTTRHLAKTIALAGAVAALAVPVAQAGSPAVDLKSLDPAIRTALVAKQARVVHADDRAGLRGVSPSFDATLDPAIRTAIVAKRRGF